jgi:AbrB family looped-hinge helix DNA binding protein
MGMRASKVDAKGRVTIPKEFRERLKLGGRRVSWIPLGERIVGLEAEMERGNGSREVLAYLENLGAEEIKRLGEPEYGEIPKSELWLKALKK